ncbi:hypothetical protein BC834DRAFT_611551 [Gloeopeniophorella convolvens]|nr:hypothetical protein BC834DRAFT_611551 [Gloeopeniophorella convolvens]
MSSPALRPSRPTPSSSLQDAPLSLSGRPSTRSQSHHIFDGGPPRCAMRGAVYLDGHDAYIWPQNLVQHKLPARILGCWVPLVGAIRTAHCLPKYRSRLLASKLYIFTQNLRTARDNFGHRQPTSSDPVRRACILLPGTCYSSVSYAPSAITIYQ